ncbi:MAG: flagellar hook capping FlgD N-terminal domain-containing protein [Clostridiaceae bacterium]
MAGYSVNSSYVSSTTGSKTANGTRIVTGKEADKNMFVKLLAAQLSNQDPSKPTDSTQYVSQMAQFSALEQMTNLNGTMSYMSASNMVGKVATTKYVDTNGNPIKGTVTNVTKVGDAIKIYIDGYEDPFNLEDVAAVEKTDSLVDAGGYVGKNVYINKQNADGTFIKAKVTSVVNGLDGIYAKVKYNDGTKDVETTINVKDILGITE